MNEFIRVFQENLNTNFEVSKRDTVRGIIYKNNKILLVYSNKDKMYGTPGGGVDEGETLITALKRELLEEIGAKSVKVIEEIGKTTEFRESNVYENMIYNPTSYYYLCEVNEFTKPDLLDYEKEIGLEPRWVNIDEAIKQNLDVLKEMKSKKENFFSTQVKVFRYIKNRYNL